MEFSLILIFKEYRNHFGEQHYDIEGDYGICRICGGKLKTVKPNSGFTITNLAKHLFLLLIKRIT